MFSFVYLVLVGLSGLRFILNYLMFFLNLKYVILFIKISIPLNFFHEVDIIGVHKT